jgi:prolyl-tRNA synthetase
MMQNGLALQAGTSHDLGQNFAKAFDIRFQNQSGELEYVWQTSWGVSTRLIGALIMVHSDDKGLVLPPKLAALQAVFIPIYRKDEERTGVLAKVNELAQALRNAGLSVQVDDREGYTPGSKFYHWEQRGVPLVIELGPRDLAARNVVVRRRDSSEKQTHAASSLVGAVQELLNQMQSGLLEKARQRMEANTVLANSLDEVRKILEPATAEKGGGQFVMALLKDDPACDARLKEFKASVRCIPLEDRFDGPGKCIVTGEQVPHRVVIAKAY